MVWRRPPLHTCGLSLAALVAALATTTPTPTPTPTPRATAPGRATAAMPEWWAGARGPRLVLRGGSGKDGGAGAGPGAGTGAGAQGEGDVAEEKHWLRSGARPPRYTHALSSPKMEQMMRDLELDLEDETEAQVDALIRELDQELPPEDEPDVAGADAVRKLRERAQLLAGHRPSLYNYARALHLSGDEAGAARLYAEAITCAPVTIESSATDRRSAASACCNLGVLYYGGGGAMPNQHLVNYTAAQEMFERALELQHDMVEPMCNLAVLLQGLGQRASSRETIKVKSCVPECERVCVCVCVLHCIQH